MKIPILAVFVLLYSICLTNAYFPWNAKVSLIFLLNQPREDQRDFCSAISPVVR